MSRLNGHSHDAHARLSLGQASRLSGMPKAYLRELVESGRLAVHHMPQNGETKLRVTAAGLVDAGVLPGQDAPAAERGNGESVPNDQRDQSELVALIRAQSERITSLEEQRFQLGAQLGAAVERIASLEERIASLLPATATHAVAAPPGSIQGMTEQHGIGIGIGIEASDGDVSGRRLREFAVRLAIAGVQHSTRLGASVLRHRARPRFHIRRTSSSPAD